MRSFLFVPADDPRKLAKATQSSAHVLVLDLEDAVLPDRKAAARKLLAEWAAPGHASTRLWVRINEPDSAAQLDDFGRRDAAAAGRGGASQNSRPGGHRGRQPLSRHGRDHPRHSRRHRQDHRGLHGDARGGVARARACAFALSAAGGPHVGRRGFEQRLGRRRSAYRRW